MAVFLRRALRRCTAHADCPGGLLRPLRAWSVAIGPPADAAAVATGPCRGHDVPGCVVWDYGHAGMQGPPQLAVPGGRPAPRAAVHESERAPAGVPDQVHQRLPYTPFFPAYAVQAAGLRAMASRVEYEVMVRVRDQAPWHRPARAVVRSILHRVLRMAWALDDVANDSDSEFTLAAVAAEERKYSRVTAASTRASSLSLTQFNPNVHL